MIPAFGLTLLSYFRLNKRYRCTRNRITSIVLHLVIMVLSIALLAGFTMDYYKPNPETEVILLVDSSFTMNEDSEDAETFIKSTVDNCDSMYKLGIVKFGYDQVYAAQLTNNMTKLYSDYITSPNPDITATDISSALTYTASLFTSPETARIVIVTDALETDGRTRDIIRSLAAKGIAVDTVYYPGNQIGQEVQIVDAAQSVDKVELGVPLNINLTIMSSFSGPATVTPYDDNRPGLSVDVDLKEGKNEISIPYTFSWSGLHPMSYEIASTNDTLTQNNTFVNYVYIETFDKILAIESIPDESSSLLSMLKEELKSGVEVVDVTDPNKMPQTVDQLRAYDEVVLVNISHEDMPVGFEDILYEYVHTWGGGLFTISGNEKNSTEDNWTANAYTRKDMYGTRYQEMLPVEIVEYSAPVGVIILVDTSGSMLAGGYKESKLFWAIEGAKACVEALTDRDYIGVMTLSDSYTKEAPLTPRSQREEILTAIARLDLSAEDGTIESGGTLYSPAFECAGKTLAARSDIEKKHIIIVSDGEPAKTDTEMYRYWAQENAKHGITMSFFGVDPTTSAQTAMETLLEKYAGCKKENFHAIFNGNYSQLPEMMRKDLERPEIQSVNYEEFIPRINGTHSITNKIDPADMPSLYGYYGVKLKPGATAALMGKYTPIYSEWTFGKGRVGTFSCDLNGNWSRDFIASEVGVQLVNNIINHLFPTENIRPSDIDLSYTGDNYTTNLSILTTLEDNQSIKVTVTAPDTSEQVFVLNNETGYSRLTFAVKKTGVNTIKVQKLDETGNELSYKEIYKTLSYSKEYDAFADKDAAKALAEELSLQTKGEILTDPLQVFENAVEYLHIIIDPRIAFAIIIIVCFLLDIIVRKFKWKWPHEIVRDKKRNAIKES